jgi:hypothetical protein
MTKIVKLSVEKNLFLNPKNAMYLSLGFMTDAQAAGEASRPQTRTSSTHNNTFINF